MTGIPAVKLGLARKLLWRDWNSGELNILLTSLLLAVATVTSISLFSSRIHNSIYEEASHFIAADAKVTGSLPAPDEWKKAAQAINIKTADIIRFRAMTFSDKDMVLTQVKAVSANYPLKGSLAISDRPYEKSRKIDRGPRPGEAWIAPRLFSALNINSGDRVTIGDAEFVATASLNKEPDAGQSLFGVAPRVMINIADIDATGAIQVGSRVDHDWLLAGANDVIDEFEQWLQAELGNHHRWVGVKAENRGIGSALTRAERFLLLTGCLSVVLSGVAIALAAKRYAKRQQAQVAILKTLGSGPQNILRLYSINILLIGIFSILAGGGMGWLLHWGILTALGDLIPADLAPPSLSAYSTGAVTGFVALWAFAAPPIFALRQVAPATILREHKEQGIPTGRSTGIGAAAIVLLMIFYSRDWQLSFIVAAGSAVCLAGVGTLSSGLILLTRKIGNRLSYSWRLGLANLKRHRRFNALQMMIFSVLLMLLFILLTVRTTLLNQWQNQLPPDTPNHFAFNIFPNEAQGITNFFQQNNVFANPFYPMTRGRVVGVNGVPTSELIKNQKNNINYPRELNLTWADTLGADNKILYGQWWDEIGPSEELLVSAEQEYANGLGIVIGDRVEFSVAGQEVRARVASIRSVQWDSMNPNFFMIFNREILDGVGANWITSFYLPQSRKPILNALSRQYPTVSLVEIDQTIEQIQSIIGKVSMAIEFILVLVLASGFLVLITSIQATLDVRVQESAIFRTIGADKALVRKTLIIEFSTLGLLAGILAVVGTELCLYFLQTRVFNLAYQSQGLLWLWGPALSAFLIGSVGWISTRNVINTPPLAVLREV